MSTLTATPVGFRCTHCYQQTLAMADDAGQSVRCMRCQELNEVPPATEDLVRVGSEVLATLQAQSADATPTSQATTTSDNPYASPSPYAASVGFSTEDPNDADLITIATKGSRFVGAMLDGLATIVVAGIGLALAHFLSESLAVVAVGFPIFALAIFQWVCTATEGKTIGKYCMGTKVIDANGNPPGFLKGVVLRKWVIFLTSGIPIVGIFVSLGDPISIFFSETHRCWHDKIAKTLVIQE